MAKTSKDTIIRKLPLPIEIKLGNDTTVTDGFFSLTTKETGRMIIKAFDEDGYATCEIFPPKKEKSTTISVIISGQATLIGTAIPQTVGGIEPCSYKYYRKPDGSFYAMVSGKSRTRRIRLGRLNDQRSKISTFAQALARNLNGKEFTKKDIMNLAGTSIPKRLTSGQILKSLLDILKLLGYLEKRETTERGRIREYFKATKEMFDLVDRSNSLEQA